ncbi:hypothetical protein Y032_0626g819 [Ancylostoma ceylanicum]|nr:hypothetical protein Y032_0626g819 [Ancylostoma ceylanicum]
MMHPTIMDTPLNSVSDFASPLSVSPSSVSPSTCNECDVNAKPFCRLPRRRVFKARSENACARDTVFH